MERDCTENVTIDTKKGTHTVGNYISNPEVLDQWLDGVRPESSLSIQQNCLLSEVTLQQNRQVQMQEEIFENNDFQVDTEPPQTVNSKINLKMTVLSPPYDFALIADLQTESLAATSRNGGQNKKMLLESASNEETTSRHGNKPYIQDLGSIHLSQGINSPNYQSQGINTEYSQKEFAKTTKNANMTSLDLPQSKLTLNSAESAKSRLNPNSSGNLHSSGKNIAQTYVKDEIVEVTVSDRQSLQSYSLHHESNASSIKKPNQVEEKVSILAPAQVESPKITEEDAQEENPTDQNYTQVYASVETQSPVPQNSVQKNPLTSSVVSSVQEQENLSPKSKQKKVLDLAQNQPNVVDAEVITLNQENFHLTKEHKESQKEIYDSREQKKQENQKIIESGSLPKLAKQEVVSPPEVSPLEVALVVKPPTMFNKKAVEMLVEMDNHQSTIDQKAQSKKEIKPVDLVICKQAFSGKPVDSPKLDDSNKIVKIKVKSSTKLKFQFTNVSKKSPLKAPMMTLDNEQPSVLSFPDPAHHNKGSLSNATDKKLKFLKTHLQNTSNRLRSLENKRLLNQKSELGSMIASHCDNNSVQNSKIEQVAQHSHKNRHFIEQLDKRPFSMENKNRRKPITAAQAALRTDKLNQSLRNSNQFQTGSNVWSPKINSENQTAKNRFTVYELEYSGLTRAEIEALPVKELFKRMNRNLRGINRQTIQERCVDITNPKSIAQFKKRVMSPDQQKKSNCSNIKIGQAIPSSDVKNWGFYQDQYEGEMILASSAECNLGKIFYQKFLGAGKSDFSDRVSTANGGQRITRATQQEGRGRRIQDILTYVKTQQKPQQNFFTQRENTDIVFSAPPKRKNDRASLSDQDFDETKLLEDFLQEQDRRVDFGQTQLFQKIMQNQSAVIQAENVLAANEVEDLLRSLKDQRRVTDEFDGDYIQQTQKKIMQTLLYLMSEIGLGQRFEQMIEEERGFKVTLERLRILTGRARKVYRARQDLVYIFQVLLQFEQEQPALLNKLAKIRGVISEQGKETLRSEAVKLKNLVVQLVYSIRQLLHSYKFYNESFVFNDRDYLKHVANEMKEMKVQYAYLKVPFS